MSYLRTGTPAVHILIIAAFDRWARFECYLFNKREQQEGESIDQYIAQLRILAQ